MKSMDFINMMAGHPSQQPKKKAAKVRPNGALAGHLHASHNGKDASEGGRPLCRTRRAVAVMSAKENGEVTCLKCLLRLGARARAQAAEAAAKPPSAAAIEDAHNRMKMTVKCLERAERELTGFDIRDRQSNLMDLDSLNEGDIVMDWQKLLDAPMGDFGHDMHGIRRFMDRRNWPGKLTGCFLPRAAKHQTA